MSRLRTALSSPEVRAELYALAADLLLWLPLLVSLFISLSPWAIAACVVGVSTGIGFKVASLRLKTDLSPAAKRGFIISYVVMGAIFVAAVAGGAIYLSATRR